MPWYKLGAFGGSGGGSGGNSGNIKKSFVLPVNVSTLTVNSTTTDLILTWEIPDQSEMQIEKFNIYYTDASTNPILLSDFTFCASVGSTTTAYTITGLDSSKTYKIVVESVSVEGYENASLKGVANGKLITANFNDPGYFVTTSSGQLLFANEELDNWTQCNLPENCLAFQIYNMHTNRLLLLSKSGDVYYSDTGENWILALSTGVTVPNNANSHPKHFAIFNNCCYLCVDYISLHRTTDGINWEAISVPTDDYDNGCFGAYLHTIDNYLYKFNGSFCNTGKVRLSRSQDGINWTMCSNQINDNYNIIYDIGCFNDYIYTFITQKGFYSMHKTGSGLILLDAAYNNDIISNALYSERNNKLIFIYRYLYNHLCYVTTNRQIVRIDFSTTQSDYNTEGYFYDEHTDKLIVQSGNMFYVLDPANISSGYAPLENATYPYSTDYINSLIYKST